MLGTVKLGIEWSLEEQAHALLMKDRKDRGLKGVLVQTEEYCWLSDHQLLLRQQREVYTSIGFPDAELMEGRVFRAYNPLFGNRPNRHRSSD